MPGPPFGKGFVHAHLTGFYITKVTHPLTLLKGSKGTQYKQGTAKPNPTGDIPMPGS